jgi:hypothetical protein
MPLISTTSAALGWSGNGLRRHFPVFDSAANCFVGCLGSRIFAPATQCLGFPKRLNSDAFTGVFKLLSHCNKLAVAWMIAELVVFSVYCKAVIIAVVSGPLFKRRVVVPLPAHSNTKSAIVFPPGGGLPIAAVHHSTPNVVQSTDCWMVSASSLIETIVRAVLVSVLSALVETPTRRIAALLNESHWPPPSDLRDLGRGAGFGVTGFRQRELPTTYPHSYFTRKVEV